MRVVCGSVAEDYFDFSDHLTTWTGSFLVMGVSTLRMSMGFRACLCSRTVMFLSRLFLFAFKVLPEELAPGICSVRHCKIVEIEDSGKN